MKKKKYEPPIACDLSGVSIRGQTAHQPQSTCANGSKPGSGSCLTGWWPLTPSVCNPTGSSPTTSGCSFGLIATPVRCSFGSVPVHT